MSQRQEPEQKNQLVVDPGPEGVGLDWTESQNRSSSG